MPEHTHFDIREASKRFIAIRTENNLTQEELAKKLDVSLQTIKNYEKAGSLNVRDSASGERKDAIAGMKIETLFKIANELHVSSDYLLGLTDIKSPSTDTQAIIEHTGLTEKNTQLLEILKNIDYQDSIDLINDLISITNARELLTPYILMRSTLALPPAFIPDNGEDNLHYLARIAALHKQAQEYGCVYLAGKQAFEYYCSRIAKEIEIGMIEKYESSANWKEQNGND